MGGQSGAGGGTCVTRVMDSCPLNHFILNVVGHLWKTAPAADWSEPRQVLKHSRSRPELFVNPIGPSGPTRSPPCCKSILCRGGSRISLSMALFTFSSDRPHAEKFRRSSFQQGFGNRSWVPAHAGQKPHVSRCSGRCARKSCGAWRHR